MPDREKVIEHITDCVRIADCQINHNWVFVRTDILKDALALLKAQEPRIVTINDFEGADEYGWLPAWCEEYAGAIYCECILVDALKEKGIRYWTSRPDEKRRVEIPWN